MKKSEICDNMLMHMCELDNPNVEEVQGRLELVETILMRMLDLEKAMTAMSMSFPDGDEPDWWNECLAEIDEGITNGRNILIDSIIAK